MCVQMAGKPDIYSSAGRPHGELYSERAVQMAGKPDINSSAGRPHGELYSERAERNCVVFHL